VTPSLCRNVAPPSPHSILICTAATVSKLIKEMMPEDIKCAGDTRDLILECCVGTCLLPRFASC
jgi:hypothetical protein